MEGQPSAVEVPPNVRMMLELVGERLDLAAGQCRLEVEFQDGEVLHVWRHEKVKGTALGRFDRPAESA